MDIKRSGFLGLVIAMGTIATPATANEFLSTPTPSVPESRLVRSDNSTDTSGGAIASGTNISTIFVPYIEELQHQLPAVLQMRLPSEILINSPLNQNKNPYIVRIFSFETPSHLTVALYHCDDGSTACLAGQFSVDERSSLSAQAALTRHQAAATPITLARNVQGHFLAESQPGTNYVGSSVIWEQDGMIYTISLPTQDRQNLLYMAHSMANATPIQSTLSQVGSVNESGEVGTPPTIERDLALVASLALPPAVEISEPLQAQNPGDSVDSVDGVDGDIADTAPPGPLPEDLEVDVSGGRFPLGVIRPTSTLQLQLGSSVFTNSNIGSSSIEEDTTFLNSAALLALPELGPNTRLAANVGGDFVRFSDGGGYETLRANLGVLQELGENTSLAAGLGYRQIYGLSSSDLTEYSARLGLNRVDQLDQRLFLNSGYEFQANFAQDPNQNRLTNSLRLNLAYSFSPELQGSLGYRLILDAFTDQDAFTARHQLGTQLTYQINRNLFVGGSVSYLFGESIDLLDPESDPNDLNNISFGLHVGLNLSLMD